MMFEEREREILGWELITIRNDAPSLASLVRSIFPSSPPSLFYREEDRTYLEEFINTARLTAFDQVSLRCKN